MENTCKDIENLKKELEALKNQQNNSAEEIQKGKLAIQAMKTDIINTLQEGYFIRDNNRIIISAPEIIIGNVDKNGVLLGATGDTKVCLRGTKVNLEGIDIGDKPGSITTRASLISQIAVDPGLDGFENNVKNHSKILTRAENIAIDSQAAVEKCFIDTASNEGKGVSIKSDSTISLSSTKSVSGLKERLKQEEDRIKRRKKDLDKTLGSLWTNIETAIRNLEGTKNGASSFIGNKIPIRKNFQDIDNLHDQFNESAESLCKQMAQYYTYLAQSIEYERILKALATGKGAIPASVNIKTDKTDTSIILESEKLTFNSQDGDGKIRTNPNATINMNAPIFKFSCHDNDKCLIDKSKITLSSKEIKLDTSSHTPDHKEKLVKDGKVRIIAQDFRFDSIDYKLKDEGNDQLHKYKKEVENDDLTGKFVVRTKDIEIDTTTKKLEPQGSFVVNAQKMELKAVKYRDEQKKQEEKVNPDSSLVLVADTITGGRGGATKIDPQKINFYSSKVINLSAKEELYLIKDKSKIYLSDDTIGFMPEKFIFHWGSNSFFKDVRFRSDIAGTKATFDGFVVKDSYQGPNTNDIKKPVTPPAPDSTTPDNPSGLDTNVQPVQSSTPVNLPQQQNAPENETDAD